MASLIALAEAAMLSSGKVKRVAGTKGAADVVQRVEADRNADVYLPLHQLREQH